MHSVLKYMNIQMAVINHGAVVEHKRLSHVLQAAQLLQGRCQEFCVKEVI